MRILFILFIGFALSIHYFDRSSRDFSNRQTAFIPSPFIQYFHFGYADVLADSLWIKYNESYVNCHAQLTNSGVTESGDDSSTETAPSKSTGDSPDFSPSRAKAPTKSQSKANSLNARPAYILDVERENLPVCHKLWSFRVLDLVTDLAPKFYVAYSIGALTLSIIVDDIQGASKLFEKGILVFPNKSSLLSRAGYHFLVEANDPVKAAKYLSRAALHGGTSWHSSLAARLLTESGKNDLAISVLRNYLDEIQDARGRELITKRLNKLLKAQNEAGQKK